MDERYILKGLDEPVPILFWTPMEFIVMVMILGVGIVAKQLLFGMIGAYICLKISRKLSRGAKRGQSKHGLWRMGVSFIDPPLSKKMPHPVQTDFCE